MVGKTGDLSRLPEYMKAVELHQNDVEMASRMLGQPISPGTYTYKDGDKYCVAMAATFKGSRVNVKLIR